MGFSRQLAKDNETNITEPARRKRNSQKAKTHVERLLFQLLDNMHSMGDADFFLDRAQESVKKAIDEHANYNTADFDRSRKLRQNWRGGGLHGGVKGSCK